MQFSFSETIVGSVENLELKFWSKNKKLQKVLFPPWNWENKPVSIFVSLLDSPPVGWVPKYSKCVFNHQHKILTLQTCRESSFELKLILKKKLRTIEHSPIQVPVLNSLSHMTLAIDLWCVMPTFQRKKFRHRKTKLSSVIQRVNTWRLVCLSWEHYLKITSLSGFCSISQSAELGPVKL